MNTKSKNTLDINLNLPITQHDQLEKQYIVARHSRGKDVEYTKTLVNIPFIKAIVHARFEDTNNSIALEMSQNLVPVVDLKVVDYFKPSNPKVVFERTIKGQEGTASHDALASAIEHASAYPKTSLRAILEFSNPSFVEELKKNKRDKKHVSGIETAVELLESMRQRLKIIYPETDETYL